MQKRYHPHCPHCWYMARRSDGRRYHVEYLKNRDAYTTRQGESHD